nr:hypothetical protein [Anaerolineae bacterium]
MTMVRLFTRQTKEREQRDELLSAYLDGQLSAGERARLEAQLAADPALRAELEALRHTVTLVRDLPLVSIPRNFILSPAVAARPRPAPLARPRRAWAAPLLTAATAVVSLLFVVVLAGDLLLSGVGRLASGPAAPPPVEAPQVALEPSPIIETEVEEAMRSGVMPTATPLPMPTEAPLEAVPEATAEAERYVVRTPEGMESPVPAMPVPTAVPTVVAEAAAVPTTPVTATAVPEKGVGGAELTPGKVAEVAPPVVGEEEAEAAEGERGALESEAVGLPSTMLWRVLEVVLGLTALALALATAWAWRARRR